MGILLHVWSDGTNWYLDGQCKVQDGITTTQARLIVQSKVLTDTKPEGS
jgi:hypothetical protein